MVQTIVEVAKKLGRICGLEEFLVPIGPPAVLSAAAGSSCDTLETACAPHGARALAGARGALLLADVLGATIEAMRAVRRRSTWS